MADIAKRLAERDFDIIDVNMGCPVPKVVNNGEGSAPVSYTHLMQPMMRIHQLMADFIRTQW